MKTVCAVEMPRAVPGLVWGQRALLSSFVACSQLYSTAAAHCDVFQGLSRSCIPPPVSLVTQIFPESIVFLWGSLALCCGGHHAMSKMQNKRLVGTAWAGLGCGFHCVNWLWRSTAPQSMNHHPLPRAGTTWHLKHQETLYKNRLSDPQRHVTCIAVVY